MTLPDISNTAGDEASHPLPDAERGQARLQVAPNHSLVNLGRADPPARPFLLG
ncbi:hypothetical protein PhaeoP88_04683 (plasmid) [Phaeobacter inhibens]|uniref:Uncharacterized protein n=1 Tax=Phaeobacter inhibens TaxID=221822 RepID=A0A2I7KHC5_9RHOB|nr:hypothetical protein PhaeoP88_04683 [Phaeobacter inhibens]